MSIASFPCAPRSIWYYKQRLLYTTVITIGHTQTHPPTSSYKEKKKKRIPRVTYAYVYFFSFEMRCAIGLCKKGGKETSSQTLLSDAKNFFLSRKSHRLRAKMGSLFLLCLLAVWTNSFSFSFLFLDFLFDIR